jgi:hypothetical protein
MVKLLIGQLTICMEIHHWHLHVIVLMLKIRLVSSDVSMYIHKFLLCILCQTLFVGIEKHPTMRHRSGCSSIC